LGGEINNFEIFDEGMGEGDIYDPLTGLSVTPVEVSENFNPARGAALGLPLFIGLGMLRKRATKKVAAQKVAELVS
ncbi:MAG: hypothetical protein WBB28_10680, partial [Crinalium sp.]